MKILFVADLHGNQWKYGRLLELAQRHGVKVLVNGGDMLPKGRKVGIAQIGPLELTPGWQKLKPNVKKPIPPHGRMGLSSNNAPQAGLEPATR